MGPGFPLNPEQASTFAVSYDHLHYFLTAITLFFTTLIFALVFFFAVKYRRRSEDEMPPRIEQNILLEIIWIGVPGFIVLILFVWGALLFFQYSRPPRNAMEVFVVGKQWMWHLQHPEGVREINELHVPLGRPVKLALTSEDVIHDFFIPAFRVKHDVVPGRYDYIWFEATKVGRYHFFCSQYCGAFHSQMIGWVEVMKPEDYEAWLTGAARGENMADAGYKLYHSLACVTCHGTGRGPAFNGLYGKSVQLSAPSTTTVTADDAYLRESILYPSVKLVAGYPAIMPTFKGQVSEEQILQLIAYIKSMAGEERNLGKP
jgi:cytochrome c oxidase subunit 2